jgi:hypothetical protein
MANEHPGEVRLNGFECVLPPNIRAELMQSHKTTPLLPPVVPVERKTPPSPRYIRGVINIAVIAIFLFAALIGVLSSHTSVPAPAAPIAAQTPRVDLAHEWSGYFPAGRDPLVRRALPAAPRATLVKWPAATCQH